jgi:fluoride ion exporter CrcB/FEX
MSTFAMESIELIQDNQFMAIMYIFISVFGSIFLAWGGYSVMINIMQ